jgi:hypothetical protein
MNTVMNTVRLTVFIEEREAPTSDLTKRRPLEAGRIEDR